MRKVFFTVIACLSLSVSCVMERPEGDPNPHTYYRISSQATEVVCDGERVRTYDGIDYGSLFLHEEPGQDYRSANLSFNGWNYRFPVVYVGGDGTFDAWMNYPQDTDASTLEHRRFHGVFTEMGNGSSFPDKHLDAQLTIFSYKREGGQHCIFDLIIEGRQP